MILILLASYNGEAYISEQIDSILGQTVQDFVLHIRDDASTDNTRAIIEDYRKIHPDKIRTEYSAQNSGSAKHNFLYMMIAHKDDYVMLCDQDDVWLPQKIEKTLETMHCLEDKHGIDMPLLIHTDLAVVDERLTVLHKSFHQSMAADCTRTQLRDLVIQNILAGCTAMYNRALADLIDTMPPYCGMHDWWLILVACTFGRIGYLNMPTILYRQHQQNQIGAKNVRTLRYKMDRILNREAVKRAIAETYPQARSLLSVYADAMTPPQRELLEAYCKIPSLCKAHKWFTICKIRSYKTGIFRNIAYFLFV